MATPDEKLIAECRVLAQANADFAAWIAANPDRFHQEHSAWNREQRHFGAQLRRLEATIQRPMCAGVFGPSQSGKSYLISALARHGAAPLLANFAGHSVDFIRDINPEGGRESTGLVTRFTLQSSPTPPGAPVSMRLLSQTDIVKIIGNTYYADCDHSDEELPTQARLNEALEALASAAQATPIDPLTADDVYDLQAYFERRFKGAERIRWLRHGFWERAAELAPRLRSPERARLFALLWNEVEPFTRLYQQLYAGLQALNFAGEAYAGLDALLPRAASVIDVQTLQGLGTDGGDRLTLTSAAGAAVALPRSSVTALIAELRIVISEQPWDFFQHTDLLDFPGARSREQIKDLPGYLQNPAALQSLFLRGKVAYLFERYCAEQELTSMLLCIGPSNQEVNSLPEMIYDWIASTHGATPEQRSQQPTALFLVLTKFDMEFEEKAGESSPESRWITRLESSLLKFFGKQHDWPQRWDNQGCFRNSYWLRNPNFKAKNLFDYDAAGREIGIRPGERERIESFRQAFLKDASANRHFQHPEEAWAAAFALNDGGVTYLAENLRPLCNPDLKRQQLAGQLERRRQQLVERIRPYYISGNPEQAYERRCSAARRIAGQLIDCAGEQRFGELLCALQMDSETLEDIYYRIETRLPGTGEAGSAPSIGAPVDRARMTQLLGLSAPKEDSAAPASDRRDAAALFAREALAAWLQDLRALAGNSSRCDYYRLPEAAMVEFVQELIAGAQRLDLEQRITALTREATRFRLKFQQTVALPARLTANVINHYIDFLGYDALPLQERPTLTVDGGARPVFQPRQAPRNGPVLGEEPSSCDQEYYTDWIRGFLDLVERNAKFQSGMTLDIAANQQLGQLLEQLGAVVD